MIRRQHTLSEKVEAELLYQILYGKFRTEKQLPPETEIAKHLGVSRNVVRNGMSVLEQEGFISRSRGVGTIVNKHVLEIQTRMDIADKFENIIESAGCAAGCSYFDFDTDIQSDEIAELLEISQDSKLYRITRVMTADDVPAVFCQDYVPASLIDKLDEEKNSQASKISTYEMLLQNENPEVYLAVADVSAVNPSEMICDLCDISSTTPVLHIQAVHYSFRGQPLLLSSEYYVNKLIKQTMVRKKIYSPDEISRGYVYV